MATALQLVNRVRRELRWGDTADFTDDLSKVVLDRVNDAQATIFETWDWDCDIRHDGVLRTISTVEFTGVAITSGLVNATTADAGVCFLLYTATSGGQQPTNPIVKVIFTSDDDLGDTALRVTSMTDVTAQTRFVLAAAFPGTSTGSATLTSCANEYILPSTVRKLISATHQERSIRLEESNRSQVYDRVAARPHDNISDQPEWIMIGGVGTGTIDSTGDSAYLTGASGITALIHPTPESALHINYSYLIQRSDLSATTDTFTADRSLQAALVKLAFARCMQDAVGDFNPEAGMTLEQRVLRELAALHSNEMRDPGRHRVLGSNFCETSGKIDFGRLPRNFGTGT